MWYLRYLAYQDVFLATSTGIRERSCDLRWTKIANMPFIIPSLQEQKEISQNISKLFNPISELSKIRVEKEKLYKEYRKALVSEFISGKRRVN